MKSLKTFVPFLHPLVKSIMEKIFRDVAEVEVYIDEIGIFSDSWEQHLSVLYIKLQKLQENGFTVNP